MQLVSILRLHVRSAPKRLIAERLVDLVVDLHLILYLMLLRPEGP